MRRALERDPTRRITIPEILAHPFISPSPALGQAALADALLCCARAGGALTQEAAAALAQELLAADIPVDVGAWLAQRS